MGTYVANIVVVWRTALKQRMGQLDLFWLGDKDAKAVVRPGLARMRRHRAPRSVRPRRRPMQRTPSCVLSATAGRRSGRGICAAVHLSCWHVDDHCQGAEKCRNQAGRAIWPIG